MEVPAVDGCKVCRGGEPLQLRHRVTWHPEERKEVAGTDMDETGWFSRT